VGSWDEVGDILARELYVSAGFDPHFAPGAVSIAISTLGDRCIVLVPADDLPGNALLQLVGQRWIIYVRKTLNARQLNHAVGHELAEWFLHHRGYAKPDIEAVSNRVAAAICVPKLAFLEAHRKRGDNWKALAAEFQVSESLMALRCAECLGTPTALITSHVVLTRGKSWEWPEERDEWKRLVTRVRSRRSGLTLRTLGDAKGRVVLLVR
jgi:hypothetical protein